ncbi:MAG: S-layer homology domain-containing protein [Lutisporaceae bacterium]
MKMLLKKTICILLAFMMAFGPFAEGVVSVFARNTDNELAPDGQTWEEAYPNGAFIFEESYLYSEEGDDIVAIAVYRTGGRDSRAVANLAITPVTPEGNTANAAGLKDFEIISPYDVEIDPDNEYDTVFADLVFEEGEYVKSLEIRAIDDELSEPEEFFIVTIYGAEDAEFLEDGNRFTVCVQDNDPYVKSIVSFADGEMSFNRSDGFATLEVVRTGGTQYVFSIDYETVSGTAAAGVDFAETSGTLMFNCGEETAAIEIPLINDNKETVSEEVYFGVKLSNPKGGDIAEDGGETVIYLYNSAKKDAIMNIATLVTDLESIDISGETAISDDAIISNNDEITVTPEIKESTPLVETVPKASKGGIVPMAVVQDSWGLAANQGDWKKYTRLAYDKEKFGFGTHYDNSDDFYESSVGSADNWHTRSARSYDDEHWGKEKGYVGFGYENENRVWKVWDASGSDPYGYAIMKQPDLDGLYEFYKSMSGHVSIHFNDTILGEMNQGMVLLSNNDADYSQLSESSRDAITAVTHTGLTLAQYTGQGRNETVINFSFSPLLNINENYVNYDRPALAIFDNSWEDNTYFRTWVDDLYLERAAINNLRYEVVCKDGDEYLNANSYEALNRIKPVVSIYNNDGGTNGEGKLYVGSNLLLNESASSGAFRIKSVQLKKLVNGVWTVINTGEIVDVGGDKAVSIQLRSDDNSKIQRTRELSCLNAETDQYSLYVEMERNQRILLDYSPNVLPQDIAGGETDTDYIIRARRKAEYIAYPPKLGFIPRGEVMGMPSLVDGNLTNTYIYIDETDAKVFDFNLMKGEAIAYDGQMYYGPVPIKVEDYYEDTIYMIFYDSESMAREQEVRISGIESAEMYIDKNENGKVDAGDTMVGYLNDDRYVNSFFDREDGKQKLLKFDYVMLPRKINTTPADDTSIRYDVKASFVTTATSDAELARYTNEMKTYREIETGDTKVPIYGVEAMNGSITVPLGGDKTPPIYDETEKKWSWTPDFEGNLKTPFTNPAKIEEAERETVAGPKEISGTDEINDYIGSFRNSDQVVLQLYNNYEEMVDRYDSVSTYREIVLGEFEQDQDLKFGVPEGGDNQDTPGAEKPEMELPQIDIPAGPFKVILDGNRAGFELGIPLFGGGNQEASDKDTGVFGKNASKYLDDMKDAVGKGAPDKNIFDQLKNAAKGLDDTGKALKPKADVDVSFMFGFSASFMWEYDEIEAQWEFDEAKIFVTFNGEVKISQRLPPLPIVYVYIIFSADVEVGLNIEVDYGFEEGLRTSQVTCTGDISLEIEVEAGVGIGVDLCKFEIFLKINTGLLIKIAATAEASGVDEFSIGAALGFRAVFLCFSFEMEAISFELTYEKGRNPDWEFEWQVFGEEMGKSGQMGKMSAGDMRGKMQPRTGLRISGRTYDEQTIGSSPKRFGIMSIPQGHGVFELGEYNTGASSKELANNLRYSSDYKLFSVNGENYILYMIDGGEGRSPVDADMLVLSKIDALGNLINPVSDSEKKYTVVDKVYAGKPEEAKDSKGDSAFDVHVDGTRIAAAWIDNRVVTPDSALEDSETEEVLKNSAANTQIKYSVYDTVYEDQGFGEAVIIGTPDDNFNFLPKTATVGDKDIVFSIKAEPYTEDELNTLDTDFKDNMIEQIKSKNGLEDEDTLDEAGAKALYPYFDFKAGNFRNMNILYGKYSTFSFGVEKDGSFKITEITPNATWQSDGTRVEQADIYPLDNDEFYLAYTTSYNYLDPDDAVDMTAKFLYLRKGAINGDGKVSLEEPLLIRKLVDSEDNAYDGIYAGTSRSEEFIDPFFSGLEFMEGRLDPDESDPELMLLFNMNNRYYVINNDNLEEITDGDLDYGEITPFFELGDNTTGDGKGDFSIGLDGKGNISAVYTSPVPYTNNNAIYMTKYDPNTGTWGKGIMLAMRGMSIYEESAEVGWTEEAIKEEYNNDDYKLVFQKPKVVVGNGGSLTLVSQTALTELEEMTNLITGETVKMPKKDGTTHYTKESTRGFYTMSFPVGTRTISSPSLILDNKVFVPGARLTPRVTFKNVGDFALRGSTDKPLKINMMHGDGTNGISLAEWSVKSNIPSGGYLDTLLQSEDTVYGQIGTQILSDPLPSDLDGKYLYFTVKEDASYGDAYNYSSLDTAKPEGISWYSTDQDMAELVLEDVSVKKGGEIVTIGGERYLPVDITATVKNYGAVTASNTTLKVEYGKTATEGGEEVINYLPVSEIGTEGVVYLWEIAFDEEVSYVTNNHDYEKDGSGNYVVQTDGTLKLNNENDLLLPLSYFDNYAEDPSDRSLKLRFLAETDTSEFDEDDNNTAFAEIPPIGSIKMADRLYVVPGEPGSFAVETESSGSGAPDIELTELQASGKTAILTDMSYDKDNKKITIESSDEGETILRVADKNTAAFKDVIVKSTGEMPGAPTVDKVLPRNGTVYVYFTPPSDTGGIPLTGYIVEAKNINDETDTISRNSVASGRYEFTGLVNGRTYKFRVAAKNAAGTGPWSEWSGNATPAEFPPEGGEYAPMDAKIPILTKEPEDATAAMGGTVNLEIAAETDDGGVLSYQWYKNLYNNTVDGSPIEGAVGTAYSPPTAQAGTVYYYCIVTNTNNNAVDNKTAKISCSPAGVTVGKGTSQITLNTGGNAVYGKPVTLTAIVSGEGSDVPTGTVRFESDYTVLEDLVPIVNGRAKYIWRNASAGAHKLRAVYNGDNNYGVAEVTAELKVTAAADEDSDDRSDTNTGNTQGNNTLDIGSIDWSQNPVSIDIGGYSTVSAQILKKMADMNQSRDIVIKGKGYTITFKKGSIKDTAGQGYIDFGMTFSKIKNDKIIAAVHFNHSGKLPGEAEIKIRIGKEYAGQALYYYYKNKETGELEFMQMAVVDEEGFATVIQSSCSDYVFADARIDVLKKSLQIPQDVIPDDTTVPYFIKDGKENILKFSAVIGNMMNIVERKENEYLFKNNEKIFTDTAGHWAKKDIDFITARELLVGTAEGVFSPEASLTRGMAVTILGRLWDADTSGFTNSRFTDVSKDAYYAPYVEWAAQNGIVAGVGNGQYAPEKVVSREEIAVILANFAEFTGIKLEETNTAAYAFADEAQISPWAKADVRTIQKAGIMSGKPGNCFDPKGKCTRAEISTILRRLIMNMVK